MKVWIVFAKLLEVEIAFEKFTEVLKRLLLHFIDQKVKDEFVDRLFNIEVALHMFRAVYKRHINIQASKPQPPFPLFKFHSAHFDLPFLNLFDDITPCQETLKSKMNVPIYASILVYTIPIQFAHLN